MDDPGTDVMPPQVLEAAHAMLDAARDGRTAQLLAWIDQGAPIDLRDPSGNSLVMLAAYHGHTDLVRDLAARGADLDQLNDRGQSPLAGAVFKADLATVEALRAAGADPDAGVPSARATAEYFGVQAARDLFDRA